MTVLQLGNITIQRIVEHEIPVYYPSDFFDEATAEAVEPYREWLEPKALCTYWSYDYASSILFGADSISLYTH